MLYLEKLIEAMAACVLAWAAPLKSVGSAVAQATGRPNILVIYGDDIGITNVGVYSGGLVGD